MVGWLVDESSHTNGSSLTYSFTNDPYLTKSLQDCVREGASKWAGTVTITNRTDGSGVGKISTYSNPRDEAVAKTGWYIEDSSGHRIDWEIQINRAHTVTSTTLAHEFGHAIGLKALYSSTDRGKLMYGYENRTVTSPANSDKWGAKFITGQHTNHVWGYKYYKNDAAGNYHVKYCKQCLGLAAVSSTNTSPNFTKCTYQGADNRCTRCKTPKGAAPYSVDDPALQCEFDYGDQPQDESCKERYDELDVLFQQGCAEEWKKKLTPESDD